MIIDELLDKIVEHNNGAVEIFNDALRELSEEESEELTVKEFLQDLLIKLSDTNEINDEV